MLRGINRQPIFESPTDYRYFLSLLRKQMAGPTPHCTFYAYCLMSNHIHLILREGDEAVGNTMKRIAGTYAYYFNHKYERVGRFFQDRFKSQPVESLERLAVLMCYIHQAPVKAHLVPRVADYAWSSWREYLNAGHSTAPICHTEAILRRISFPDLCRRVETPLCEEEEAGLLGIEPPALSLLDEQAWQKITACSGAADSAEFQSIPRPQQKQYLHELHRQGVGIRMLSRLTGLPYGVVQRAVK